MSCPAANGLDASSNEVTVNVESTPNSVRLNTSTLNVKVNETKGIDASCIVGVPSYASSNTNTATVNASTGQVTGRNKGSVRIRVSCPAANGLDASSNEVTVNVESTPNSVRLNTSTLNVKVNETKGIDASCIVGVPSYASSNTNTATVNASTGQVTGRNKGSVRIRVSCPAANGLDASSNEVTVNVESTPNSVRLNTSTLNVKVNETKGIGASCIVGVPSYASSNTNTATVNASTGQVTGRNKGSVRIRVSCPAANGLDASSNEVTVNVESTPNSVRLNTSTLNVKVNETKGIDASCIVGVPSYASSNTNTATVNASTGQVTGRNKGSVRIRVSCPAANGLDASSNEVTVNVESTPNSVRLNTSTLNVKVNETKGIDASCIVGVPSYASSNTNTATVNASTGQVTGRNKGSVRIRVSCPAANGLDASSNEVTVNVESTPNSVRLNTSTLNVKVNETKGIDASCIVGVPSYASSNTNTATVNASTGQVTGRNKGSVRIRVSCPAANGLDASSNEVTVNVESTPNSVRLNTSTLNVKVNETKGIDASCIVGVPSYASSNTNTATVNASTGQVTGRNKGSVRIRVSCPAANGLDASSNEVTVNVQELPVNKVTLASASSVQLRVNQTHQISASCVSGTPRYVENTATKLLSISPSGLVQALSPNTTSVYVICDADPRYSADRSLVSFTVFNPNTVTIRNGESVTLSVGQKHDIQAACKLNNAPIYSSNNRDIASVNTSGSITGVRIGRTQVVVECPQTNAYTEKQQKQIDVIVNSTANTPSVTNGAKVKLTYDANQGGGYFSVNKLATCPAGNQPTYSLSNNETFSSNADGSKVAVKASATRYISGAIRFSVTCGQLGNYQAASASMNVVVMPYVVASKTRATSSVVDRATVRVQATAFISEGATFYYVDSLDANTNRSVVSGTYTPVSQQGGSLNVLDKVLSRSTYKVRINACNSDGCGNMYTVVAQLPSLQYNAVVIGGASGALELQVQDTKTINASCTQPNTRPTFAVNQTDAISVNRDTGLVTGLKVTSPSQPAYVIVTCPEASGYLEATRSVRVKVNPKAAVNSLTLTSPKSITFYVGAHYDVTATCRIGNPVYALDNNSVIRVTSAGKLTADQPATAYLTIRCNEYTDSGNGINYRSDQTNVAVQALLREKLYANADVVYSLKRVVSTYTGPAVRVLRHNDAFDFEDQIRGRKDTTTDIYFDANGNLDREQLKRFAWDNVNRGYAQTYAIKWYDQSGNGRHADDASQADVIVRPRLLDQAEGSADTAVIESLSNGEPALYWQDDMLFNTFNLSNTDYGIFALFQPKTHLSGELVEGEIYGLFDKLDFSVDAFSKQSFGDFAFGMGYAGYTTPFLFQDHVFNTRKQRQLLTQKMVLSSVPQQPNVLMHTLSMSKNESYLAWGNVSHTSNQPRRIYSTDKRGYIGGGRMYGIQGWIPEFIIFSRDVSDKRDDIRQDMLKRWKLIN